MFKPRLWLSLLLLPCLTGCFQTPVPHEVSLSTDPRVLNGEYSGTVNLMGEQVNLIGQSETAVYLTRSRLAGQPSVLLAYDSRKGTLLGSTEVGSDESYRYRSDDRLVRVRPGVAEVLEAVSRRPLNRFEIGAGFTPDVGLYEGGELILRRPNTSSTDTEVLSTVNGQITPVPAGLSFPVTGYVANGTLASGDLLWWKGGSSTLTNIQTGASVSSGSHHGNPCWYFNNPVNSSVSRSGRLFLSFPDGRIEVMKPDGQLETTLIASECQISSPNLWMELRPEGIRIASVDHPNRFALLDPATLELRWTEAAPSNVPTAPYGVSSTQGSEPLYAWHATDGQTLWTLPRTLLPLHLKVTASLGADATASERNYHVTGNLEVAGRRLDLDGTVFGSGVITRQFSPAPPPGFRLNAALTERGQKVGALFGEKGLTDNSADQWLILELGNLTQGSAADSYVGVLKR